VLSGVARFFVEFLRAHDEANPLGGPFTLEQWISVALCAAGMAFLRRKRPATI
jgi:prolipoprotein diacylglyceryltransferase